MKPKIQYISKKKKGGYIGMNARASRSLKIEEHRRKHPEHTIQVYKKMSHKQKVNTIRHEEAEYYFMKNKHYSYKKAHQKAIEFEKLNIPFPKKNVKRELVKIGFIRKYTRHTTPGVKKSKSSFHSTRSLYFTNRKQYYLNKQKETKKIKVKRGRKKPKKITGAPEEKEVSIPVQRIRRQVVLYKRSDEYVPKGQGFNYIEVRAVTINPEIDDKTLLLVVREQKNKLERQGVDFTGAQVSIARPQILGDLEERDLNDMKVHVVITENHSAYEFTI